MTPPPPAVARGPRAPPDGRPSSRPSAVQVAQANSGLRASECSTPVLGLIFLRYADQRFAEAAGIDPSYMSGLERGRRNPSWSVVTAVAGVLGTTTAKLAARGERIDR